MDLGHYRAMIAALGKPATRRAALRAAGLTGIGVLTASSPRAADARRRRKRRRKRCTKCEGRCLAPGDVCCPPESGGGLCSADQPVCCPPSPAFPDGRCLAAGQTCCFDVNCFATQTCCLPSPSAPAGACVAVGAPCPV